MSTKLLLPLAYLGVQLEQVPSLEPGPAEPGVLEDLLPVLNGTATNGTAANGG